MECERWKATESGIGMGRWREAGMERRREAWSEGRLDGRCEGEVPGVRGNRCERQMLDGGKAGSEGWTDGVREGRTMGEIRQRMRGGWMVIGSFQTLDTRG